MRHLNHNIPWRHHHQILVGSSTTCRICVLGLRWCLPQTGMVCLSEMSDNQQGCWRMDWFLRQFLSNSKMEWICYDMIWVTDLDLGLELRCPLCFVGCDELLVLEMLVVVDGWCSAMVNVSLLVAQRKWCLVVDDGMVSHWSEKLLLIAAE